MKVFLNVRTSCVCPNGLVLDDGGRNCITDHNYQGKSNDHRDKTMDDKLINISNDDEQNYHFCILNYLRKSLDSTCLELTNHSIKVPNTF